MPSNLRQTTHEGVYFLSREKDGGQIIRFAILKTPCCTQSSRPYLLQDRSYCRLKFYIAGIGGNFALFAPVSLTLIRWPSYMYLTRIPWRCTADQQWTSTSRISKVTDIQTNIQMRRKTLPRYFVGGKKSSVSPDVQNKTPAKEITLLQRAVYINFSIIYHWWFCVKSRFTCWLVTNSS